jgi:hypothetical protein
MDLLQPKEFTATAQDGGERSYTLSKFPAVQGREIIAKYPMSALPKLGDYQVSEETMLKLMAFVAVESNGKQIRLGTRALIDNHVPDWETLAKIEMAMMEYNCSFFQDARISNSLAGFAQKLMEKISETLTASSARSSPTTKQV